MVKTFTIKGITFQFSDSDVKQCAASVNSSSREGVKFYAKVEEKLFPVRQLLLEMVRNKGKTLPDVTTHEAIRVIRGLGFDIIEK